MDPTKTGVSRGIVAQRGSERLPATPQPALDTANKAEFSLNLANRQTTQVLQHEHYPLALWQLPQACGTSADGCSGLASGMSLGQNALCICMRGATPLEPAGCQVDFAICRTLISGDSTGTNWDPVLPGGGGRFLRDVLRVGEIFPVSA